MTNRLSQHTDDVSGDAPTKKSSVNVFVYVNEDTGERYTILDYDGRTRFELMALFLQYADDEESDFTTRDAAIWAQQICRA